MEYPSCAAAARTTAPSTLPGYKLEGSPHRFALGGIVVYHEGCDIEFEGSDCVPKFPEWPVHPSFQSSGSCVSNLPPDLRPPSREAPIPFPPHPPPGFFSPFYSFSPCSKKETLVVPKDSLVFNSHFESGNLKFAVRNRRDHNVYCLVLKPDANLVHRSNQWYYFAVSILSQTTNESATVNSNNTSREAALPSPANPKTKFNSKENFCDASPLGLENERNEDDEETTDGQDLFQSTSSESELLSSNNTDPASSSTEDDSILKQAQSLQNQQAKESRRACWSASVSATSFLTCSKVSLASKFTFQPSITSSCASRSSSVGRTPAYSEMATQELAPIYKKSRSPWVSKFPPSDRLARKVNSNCQFSVVPTADMGSEAPDSTTSTSVPVASISSGASRKTGQDVCLKIVNLTKPNLLYSKGMLPLVYSKVLAHKTGEGWHRSCENVKYKKNDFPRNIDLSSGERKEGSDFRPGGSYYTLEFTYHFDHIPDTVYFAHCYPFTYEHLRSTLDHVATHSEVRRLCLEEELCKTEAGFSCPVLTITNPPIEENEPQAAANSSCVTSATDDTNTVSTLLKCEHPEEDPPARPIAACPRTPKKKKVVFLSARVHPGESNASWMMQGFLSFILSNAKEANILRDHYIYKIVPMLNADGVIFGHYRCSLGGEDLNRLWASPSSDTHPTIFHSKQLILQEQQLDNGRVTMFCDFHGHSRKQDAFLYGNIASQPINSEYPPTTKCCVRLFAELLGRRCPWMSLATSKFKVEKDKEGTGRVIAWKQLAIPCSYTLEASFFGPSDALKYCPTTWSRSLQASGSNTCEPIGSYSTAAQPLDLTRQSSPGCNNTTSETPVSVSLKLPHFDFKDFELMGYCFGLALYDLLLAIEEEEAALASADNKITATSQMKTQKDSVSIEPSLPLNIGSSAKISKRWSSYPVVSPSVGDTRRASHNGESSFGTNAEPVSIAKTSTRLSWKADLDEFTVEGTSASLSKKQKNVDAVAKKKVRDNSISRHRGRQTNSSAISPENSTKKNAKSKRKPRIATSQPWSSQSVAPLPQLVNGLAVLSSFSSQLASCSKSMHFETSNCQHDLLTLLNSSKAASQRIYKNSTRMEIYGKELSNK